MPHLRENQRREEPPLQKTRIALPYIHNVSEATARLLAPHGIEVAHRPNQTLRSKVVRPKDPLVAMDKSAVIYKINCKNCNGNYVGETSKRLGTRIHEHKLAIRRGEQHSQLWMHMAQHDHQFDFANACIMSEEATKGGRLLKEAWYSNKDSINRHIDLHPAQQALRKWDLNRHLNQHKWPVQHRYGHNADIIPSPHPEQEHGTSTDPQYVKNTSVVSDQRPPCFDEQLEHPLPSSTCDHLPTNDPPQYHPDGPPPPECDDNRGELGRTSKRLLRSNVAGYGDEDCKKGGEKKGRNEGTTRRSVCTAKGREMTPHLDSLQTKHTSTDSSPPPPE